MDHWITLNCVEFRYKSYLNCWNHASIFLFHVGIYFGHKTITCQSLPDAANQHPKSCSNLLSIGRFFGVFKSRKKNQPVTVESSQELLPDVTSIIAPIQPAHFPSFSWPFTIGSVPSHQWIAWGGSQAILVLSCPLLQISHHGSHALIVPRILVGEEEFPWKRPNPSTSNKKTASHLMLHTQSNKFRLSEWTKENYWCRQFVDQWSMWIKNFVDRQWTEIMGWALDLYYWTVWISF